MEIHTTFNNGKSCFCGWLFLQARWASPMSPEQCMAAVCAKQARLSRYRNRDLSQSKSISRILRIMYHDRTMPNDLIAFRG